MPLVNSAGARTARLKYCITHAQSACCEADRRPPAGDPPVGDPNTRGITGNTGPYGPIGPTGNTGPTGPDGGTGSFPLQRHSDYNYGITGYISSVPNFPIEAFSPILKYVGVSDVCFPFNNQVIPPDPTAGLFTYTSPNFINEFNKAPALKLNFTRPSTPSDSFVCDINFTLTVTSTVATTIPAYSDHAMNHVSMYARLIDDNYTSLHGLAGTGPFTGPNDQALCVRRFNLLESRYAPYTSLVTARIPNPPGETPSFHYRSYQGPALYTYDFVKAAKDVASRVCYSFPVMLRLNCYYTVPPGERQSVNLELMLFEELRPSGDIGGMFGYVTNLITAFNPVRSGYDGVVTNIAAFSF